MRTIIARVRSKSPAHRRRFAFLAALSITMLIFTVWTVSLPSVIEQARSDKPARDVAPFAAVKSNFAGAFEGVREAFSGLGNFFEGKPVEYEAVK